MRKRFSRHSDAVLRRQVFQTLHPARFLIRSFGPAGPNASGGFCGRKGLLGGTLTVRLGKQNDDQFLRNPVKNNLSACHCRF